MHHLLSLAVELGRAVIALVRSFLQMPPLVSSEILLLRKTPFTEPTLVGFDDPVDAFVPCIAGGIGQDFFTNGT